MAQRLAPRTMPKEPKKSKISPGKGDDVLEVTPVAPIQVAQTRQLYRLTPITENLAQPHRQTA